MDTSLPAPDKRSQRVILVVDDMASVRMALNFLLGGFGFRVVQAASGKEAVNLLETELIDGALIDIQMPVLNGFDTCVRLQAVASRIGRPLRVWFMTGAGARGSEKRCTELGAFRVFAKPFDMEVFIQQLEADFRSPLPKPTLGEASAGNAAT